MKLTVSEAASLLGAPEERVYDWIDGAELPAQKLRGQYRINGTDLLEWATEHNISVSPRAFGGGDEPSLADALRAGGVHARVDGTDLGSILRNVVPLLPLADSADRETLLQVLLARDALGITAVGDGIAIPHVRNPIVLAPAGAVLALAFLIHPLNLHAPDGKAIDTFFLLISPTIHAHLVMLARLAHALKDEQFRVAVRMRAPGAEIVSIAARVEVES